MSDERWAPWTQAAPYLLGTAALAGLVVTVIRNDCPTESPFQQAVRRSRVGMTQSEALTAVRDLGMPDLGAASVRHAHDSWLDETRGELLDLEYERADEEDPSLISDRLTEWSITKLRWCR